MASSSSEWHETVPSCPICLEPFKQEAYLDRCFHAFCYNCIVRWSRVVTKNHSLSLSSIKCPLCKMENFSIIHAFNGESFRRNYISQPFEKSFVSSAYEFRLQCYNGEIGIMDMFDVKQYWNSRRYMKKNIWLHHWLRREIQTLIQEEDVDIIMHHIHGVVDSFMKRQHQDGIKGMSGEKHEEFRTLVTDAARPFLHGKTERFITELEMFLASGLNIEAYDKVCMQRLGTSTSIKPRECQSSCDEPALNPYLHLFSEDADEAD